MVKIYHNPRCSKSRQTLQLLEDKGCDLEVFEYLKNPVDRKELTLIIGMLGISARDLMRKKEAAYKDNSLADESLSEEQLVDAMVENPILIERPIVINGSKAAIGRPPESVLERLF